MMMPTIFEWLERFSAWRGYPAVAVVLVTAVLVALVWDWRLSIFALMVHYLFTGLLYVELMPPHMAIVKILVGLFVCLMLYFTGRQANWGHLPADLTPDETRSLRPIRMLKIGKFSTPLTALVRGWLLALAVLFGVLLSQVTALQLPLLPEELLFLNTAVWGLLFIGLTSLALADEPFQAGLGLLLFVSGFELFYSGLEPALSIFAALAIVNFGIVLVLSYLTQIRYLPATDR